MKPARSPRFQSAALRCNIAAISAWGFPETTCGAEQATNSAAPPRTDAEGSLAATLPCRLLPLRLAASLRPGLGPLLARLLLGLGSRRLLPFLRRLRPGRRHRLIPHRRRGRRH